VSAPIKLPHGFELWAHQRELLGAWESGAKRLITRWHRAAGKGIASLALMVLGAYQRPGTYIHVSPSFRKARENQWDAIDPHTGQRYLDVIPSALIVDKNENELTVTMHTRQAGKISRLMWLTAADADDLRGLHPAGAVLDEFASMDEGQEAYRVLAPALTASGGWLLITSTPKGRNHYHELWQAAQASSEWWTSTKTVRDTRRGDGRPIIDEGAIAEERRQGQHEEWIQQEYFVAFTSGLVGAYYADLLAQAEQEGRIRDVPHVAGQRVVTAWDIGIFDLTVVLYAQSWGHQVALINAEAYDGVSLAEIIGRMPRQYTYDRHIAPHDMDNREWTHGGTRTQVASQLGIYFRTVPRLSVQEGIDCVRRMFNRLVFDRRACARLLEALGEYSKRWDPKLKVFLQAPKHDWTSHYCDALRYLALGWRDEMAAPRRVAQARMDFDPFSYGNEGASRRSANLDGF
jgi:phage terminase large subunit